MTRTHRLAAVVLTAAILTTLGTAVATVAVRHGGPASSVTAGLRGVAAVAALPAAAGEDVLAVATFARTGRTPPTASQQQALRDLGLRVQALRNLPLALVVGTKSQLESAVRRGVASDVYPDERLKYHSAGSTAAVRADLVRARGFTGRGVGVAIVDTGVDATHPDLADHVTHNVKIVGPEYLDTLGGKRDPDDLPGSLVVSVDRTPYNNTDTSSGHGTHVAGIVAADAHTSPDQVGMAPDADIIGYGTGDAISIFTVLAAFDDILAHQRRWGIRVVNNSWGSSSPRLFDPAHPINLATRALHDAGVVVAFSAGNDGEEGTVGDYSVAPWVISVGSATVSKELSEFSSQGLEHDNSSPSPIPEDGHLRFDGDRIGIYHPDVSAPGTDIESSGTPTGVGVASPAPPGGTATLSGTSMSSPHIAGLAALLLQARPSLTPDQVREVIQVTAVPLGDRSPFWKAGYGFSDAQAAIDLVVRPDFGPGLLRRLQEAADARVLADRAYSVRTSDMWALTPDFVSVAGSDSRTLETVVSPDTKAIKAIVSYPSLALVGANPFDWQVSLVDAAGTTVATSTPSDQAGISSLFVDLVNPVVDENGTASGPPAVAYGAWKVVVSGNLGASDTDVLLGDGVTVAVAQLQPQRRQAASTGPTFVAGGSRSLFFQPGDPGVGTPALPAPLPSLSRLPEVSPPAGPEGCSSSAGPPVGAMAETRATGGCASGPVGYAVTHGADAPAEFTAPPLGRPSVVGGPSSFTLWLADPAAAAWTEAAAARLSYTLEAVGPDGKASPVAAGDVERLLDDAEEVGAEPTRAEYGFTLPEVEVPGDSSLRLRLRISGVYTSSMRMFFGGAYADAGMTMGTGRFVG